MSESNKWELIARYLSGNSSPEENKEIEFWINETSDNKKTFELIKQVWTEKSDHLQINSERMWESISKKAGFSHQMAKHNLLFSNKLLRYAAVIIFLILIPLIYFNADLFINPKFIEVTVDPGQTKIITLPDGTRVTLDAGSQMSYPENFSNKIRLVNLIGEAYFEVTSNPDKPFRVNMKSSFIKVLGTKFNISSWNNKSTVSVTEGKVSFSDLNETKKIILTRGFSSYIDENGLPADAEEFNIRNATSWLNKERYFSDTPLSEIIITLERWYNIEVSIQNPALLQNRLNLEIKNNPLNEILDIIAELINSKYEMKSGKVNFY